MAGEPAAGAQRFVGRDHELAVIADACAAARDGLGQLLVVSGPSGIGKTTLCAEAMARARCAGFAVGWGRGWPDAGAPALWPWTSVLTELAGPEADTLLGEGAAGGETPSRDTDRFTLFAAVAGLLQARARDAPLVVVLDDAHLADSAALLLARFVARTVHRGLVVVARRSDESGAPATRCRLDELERDAVVVPVGSFDDAETAAFLGAHGVRTERYGLAAALTRLTGGNPLLLARAVATASPGDDVGAVEHIIERSLDHLGPEQRDVLALAAILGMESTTAEVAALVGGDHGEILEALHRASVAGLGDLDEHRWSFTHDLVREAALGVLTPREAVEAHVRARDLAPLDDRPAAAARRAYHALHAADRSDADAARAVAECRTAARALGRGYDYERAADLLASAAELVERWASRPSEHVDVLLEWADALLVCGRLADARRVFDRTVELATRAGDPVATARGAIGLSGVWLNEQHSEVERCRVRSLQRGALTALPPTERALRARLAVRIAAEAVYDDGPPEAVLVALERARDVDDAGLLAEALSLTHHALLAPEHHEQRVAIADELIAVAATCGDDLHILFGLLWKAVDQLLVGDPQATRTLSELRTRADAVGCRSVQYVVSAIDVMQLIRDGRLDDAEAAANESFRLGVDVGDADAAGYYGAHLIAIRWLQGRNDELVDLAADITSSSSPMHEFIFRAAAAAVVARAGLLDEAAALVASVLEGGMAALPRSSTWLAGLANLVEVAAITGDAAVAAEAASLLRPYAARPIMPSLAIACFGSVERTLGQAAATCGDSDAAVEHLQRAVEANRRLGNRPMTAVSRADLAHALVARNRSGDHVAAADAFRGAAVAADAMGMPKRADEWRRRAADLDDTCRATILRHDPNGWIIDDGDHRLELPDLIGIHYLAALLTRPGEEVTALELIGGADVDGKPHELIDDEALRSYRRRVAEIDAELEATRPHGPSRRVADLEREREALRTELSSVLARSGRARRFTGSAERARTSVRKAITRAANSLAAADPELGEEVRTTITTGQSCAYHPDPQRPRRWVLADH
jgi:tetratricopeptide (TPR) repeat protein